MKSLWLTLGLSVWLVTAVVFTGLHHTATALSPDLQITPGCVVPGLQPIIVSGSQWPTDEAIALYWTPPNGTAQLETAVAAGHMGAFQFTWPKNVVSGVYTVQAISPNHTLSRAFLVDPTCTSPLFNPQTQIPLGRTTNSGLINTMAPSVYGPNICTNYGDPYSPYNSQWAPGLYTYQYRIRIPASYPYDVVRVELFDPDSINQTNATGTIIRTIYAIQQGLPATQTLNCSSPNRGFGCLLTTGENQLITGTVTVDDVNGTWFMRVDENKGAGIPPGDGSCGQPTTYNPAFNTQTRFELYDYAPDSNGRFVPRTLAVYSGQTGDGVRDNGDHDTDLRWVSPGAAPSIDQTVFVPTDAHSPHSFAIDLSQDIPGSLTDPATGDRFLYLGVTALSGASRNGFHIWAGPATYTNSVPSQVNSRNLFLLNNPHSHEALGVEVTAVHVLPLAINNPYRQSTPIMTLSPADAGHVVTFTAFDADVGVQRPLTFYFDTIPQALWSQSFGTASGATDPDGVPVDTRCIPNCNNQWISPTYQIVIPTFINGTPFPGGHLMFSYQGIPVDTFAWQTEAVPSKQEMVQMTAAPLRGFTDQAYELTAVSVFITPTEAITYTWQNGNAPPLVHTHSLSDTAVYQWSQPGLYTITVRANNGYHQITTDRLIEVVTPKQFFLPIGGLGAPLSRWAQRP